MSSDDQLVVLDHDHITAELPLDEYHPANHSYMQDLVMIRRAVVAQEAKMISWHVDAVKMRLNGFTNIEIAIEHKKSEGAVSNVLCGADAQELAKLLRYNSMAIDGPSEVLRRRVLWEMASDNQEEDPRVAIQCITELNKMTGVYQTGGSISEIKISINNTLLPKGKLDQ